MRADGSEEREVIASVAGGLKADCAGPDWARLTRVFCSPTLQMASFTITEKGYALTDLEKKPLPVVERDLAAGPEGPVTPCLSRRLCCTAVSRPEARPLPW